MTLSKKKHSVGMRIPSHKAARSLVEALGEATLSRTLVLSDEPEPLNNATDVTEKLGHVLDVTVNVPIGSPQATTVINMEDGQSVVTHEEAGSIDFLG